MVRQIELVDLKAILQGPGKCTEVATLAKQAVNQNDRGGTINP